jgi:hypothetical protein
MASQINTNGINVNYPTPGINNSSQGFRDNFSVIKNDLDIAATELSDLQNKAVVKSALTGVTLTNDMANTLISNASTRSFRATTYNLGGALSGVVTINASLGDVQYGTLAPSSNIDLQFSNWAPSGTQSNVQVYLNVQDTNSYINMSPVGGTINSSKTILENYVSGNVNAPVGVSQLAYRFSTLDCGVTVTVEPINRNYRATQTVLRTPVNTGSAGDRAGDICSDATYLYVCVADYDGATLIWRRIALGAY